MIELPASEIDRGSPVPFYFQLAELLEQEINQDRWKQDARLPSENELCEHFELSRTTVRQALARLEQEGMIRRERGRGTYVSDARRGSWLLQSTEGFFEDETVRSGRLVTSSILRREVGPLPRWAVDTLNLPPGSSGVALERLRSVDGKVALFAENYLPARFAAPLLAMHDGRESLYQCLRQAFGLEIAGARRSLEAVRAGERLGALLEVEPGAPIIAVHSVSWAQDLRPVDSYRAWVRTDRLTIDVNVGRLPMQDVAEPVASDGARRRVTSGPGGRRARGAADPDAARSSPRQVGGGTRRRSGRTA